MNTQKGPSMVELADKEWEEHLRQCEWTSDDQEKNYEDLCELAHTNTTALFAVKEMEKLTRQVVDLQEKLDGQTALAQRRLEELTAANQRIGVMSAVVPHFLPELPKEGERVVVLFQAENGWRYAAYDWYRNKEGGYWVHTKKHVNAALCWFEWPEQAE